MTSIFLLYKLIVQLIWTWAKYVHVINLSSYYGHAKYIQNIKMTSIIFTLSTHCTIFWHDLNISCVIDLSYVFHNCTINLNNFYIIKLSYHIWKLPNICNELDIACYNMHVFLSMNVTFDPSWCQYALLIKYNY